jgi:hypothetical protein
MACCEIAAQSSVLIFSHLKWGNRKKRCYSYNRLPLILCRDNCILNANQTGKVIVHIISFEHQVYKLMCFIAMHFIILLGRQYQEAEIHLHPRVKYDCYCANFHVTHTPFAAICKELLHQISKNCDEWFHHRYLVRDKRTELSACKAFHFLTV